jgi:hypothetical protein
VDEALAAMLKTPLPPNEKKPLMAKTRKDR